MLCFYPLSSYSSLICVWIDIPQTWTWKISEPFCSVLVLAILTLYLLGIILIPKFAVSHCTAVYPSPHYICINCLCCPFPFFMFSLMVVCLPALIFCFTLFLWNTSNRAEFGVHSLSPESCIHIQILPTTQPFITFKTNPEQRWHSQRNKMTVWRGNTATFF